ncbi:M57 family metalloprotease [Niabella hirudinis]|uniref:M57 family metalloprotease n=1 Tax=Niabella hirudinis TaxID=1285929 RepID=UPI003EC0422F
MKINQNLLLLLFIVNVFAPSCNKEHSGKIYSGSDANIIQLIARRLGVTPASVRDSGDYVIVGGDMIFNKTSLLSATSRQVVATPDSGTTITGPIAAAYQGDIKIFISVDTNNHSQTVIDRYSDAVRAAINNFNTLIPNSAIKMREVSTANYSDIKVHLVDLGKNGSGGMAWYPNNGKPGEHVYLNLSYESGYPSVAYATLLTTHELGHAIGLFHTNQIPNSSFTESWPFGFYYLKQIPGTPGFATSANTNPDPNSFILDSIYAGNGNPWSQSVSNPNGVGFSSYDKIAIQYLYPQIINVSLSSMFKGPTAYPVITIGFYQNGMLKYTHSLSSSTKSKTAYILSGIYTISTMVSVSQNCSLNIRNSSGYSNYWDILAPSTSVNSSAIDFNNNDFMIHLSNVAP